MIEIRTARPVKSSIKKYFERCFRKRQLLAFMILPIAYLIVFKYVPMVGVQLAFRKYDILGGVWESPWVGLYNFEKFFDAYYFKRVIKNTISLSFYSLIASFPLPIILALSLNAIENSKIRKTIQTTVYMPHFISTVVLVSIVFQFFNIRIGVYGNIYRWLTGKFAPDILANAKSFKHLYVWSDIWQNLGWDTIIFTAALSSVDPELHEAAQIDGASRVKRILHIDLPCLLPTATILLIMNAGSIMSVGFTKVYLMQTDANLLYSEVISTYSYKIGLSGDADFSYSTAISLFNSVVNMLMLVFVNQIAKRLSSTSLF